ncbi:MAG: hypothetical protein KAS36_07810 [Anaerolineales bacterium]|nr:hypothetical protein [Anaerolineales bacterium]
MDGIEMFSKEQLGFLSEAYDTIYNRAQALLEEFNPCEIEDGRCISRMNNHLACCSSACKYISREGCTTRNLRCKTHLCKDALDGKPELESRWKRLEKLVSKLELTYPWQSKGEILEGKKRLIKWHGPWNIKLPGGTNGD